jgi:SAM-dependent methyltransferase
MTELTSGWRSFLSHPLLFEVAQHLVGARRWLRRFVRDTLKPRKGERLLDIGCGPAAILQYLPEVEYCGFDHSQAYVAAASAKYGERATFYCEDVSAVGRLKLEPFDVAIAIGLLHHIDDAAALKLFKDARAALATGGRLITADPCFYEGMPPVTRLIVSSDRGRNVRTFDDYLTLAQKVFPNAIAEQETGLLPFPHSICKVVCRKEKE